MNQSITKEITTITAFLMLMFSVKTFGQIQPDVPTDAPPIFEKTISDVVNGPYEKTIEFTQNEDEFTVFEIAGYGVNTYAILNKTLNLKDTIKMLFSYYYPYKHYMLDSGLCKKCEITYGAIENRSNEKLIEINLKTYKKKSNNIRFQAEILHHKWSLTDDISEQINIAQKEIALQKNIGERLKVIGINRYIYSQTSETEKQSSNNPKENGGLLKLPKNNPDYLYNDTLDKITLARASSARSNDEKAIEYLSTIKESSLKLTNNLKEKLLYEEILSTFYQALAQAYLNVEPDSKKTEEILNKLFDSAHTNNSYTLQVIAYNNLGYLKRQRHELDEALEYHSKALELTQKPEFIKSLPKSEIERLTMLTNYYLAVITAIKGRYYDSINLINKAETVAQKHNSPEWLAHIKAAKGRIFLELQQYDLALLEYEEAWQLYNKMDNQEQLGVLSINLGRLYSETGNHELALEYINKSRDLFTEKNDIEYQLRSKETLANAYLAKGDYSEANSLYNELIKLKNQSNDSFFEGRILTKQAESLIGLGSYSEAITILETATNLQREKKDDLYYLKSNYLLAECHGKIEPFNMKSVQLYIEEAEGVIEKIRSKLHDDSLRQQYFALQKSIYELEISLYMKNSDLKNAIKSSERFRSRTLIESIAPEIKKNKPSEPFKTESDRLVHLLNDLKNDSNDTEQFSPTLSYLKSLDSDTALLYYFSGTNESFSWLITQDSIDYATIPQSSLLALDVNNYIKTINKTPSGGLNKNIWINLFNETNNLSTVLIGPYINKLNNYKNIVIFPDGPLHRVPFSALDSKLDDNKTTYLMESHNISYSPSLYIHEKLLNTKNENVKNSLLLVANPEISLYKNSTNEFTGEIPSTQNEAEAINKLWKNFGTVEFLEKDQANKKNLNEKIKFNYEILHFATHALANWDNPNDSSIALSNINSQLDENPNITLQEIKSWKISSELVVLSACDTAIGLQIEGEGPIGLSRAFIEAGSTRVIASLWPIDDSASAELMKQFYVNLFTKELDPASALAAAQKEIKRRTEWNHPYYWSGFNLFGNPNKWKSNFPTN